MAKEKKDKNFIKQPIYEGGPQALRAFVSRHLRYPEEALKNGVEGTVVVHYTIDHGGKVIEAKVVSGLSADCNEEALRVVKMLTFKVPKTRGVKIQFHKNIQIHFKLPQKNTQQVPENQQVQYQFIPQAKAEEKESPPASTGSGYSYTIQFP